MPVAVYPGSFDPPTVAHLAVAEAALGQGSLERVVLVLSEVALGKESGPRVALEDRLSVLEELSARLGWLSVARTTHQLLADVATGYDVVVVGADKWQQLIDPAWYPTPAACAEALARLPPALVAPRPPSPLPAPDPPRVRLLELGSEHHPVSSSGVAAGRHEWMLPEAHRFAQRTGAWSDEERYRAWAARVRRGTPR